MDIKQQEPQLSLQAGRFTFLIENNSIEVSPSVCNSAKDEIMGLAKLVLAHHLSGIDVRSEEYQSGLQYAVETIISDCGAEGQYMMRSA